jgi:lipoyl(octanoyl) transferase
MDLEPFSRISPCGYPDMPVSDLRSLGIVTGAAELEQMLAALIAQQLESAIMDAHFLIEERVACA